MRAPLMVDWRAIKSQVLLSAVFCLLLVVFAYLPVFVQVVCRRHCAPFAVFCLCNYLSLVSLVPDPCGLCRRVNAVTLTKHLYSAAFSRYRY